MWSITKHKIVASLHKDRSTSIDDLANTSGVSKRTLRRRLPELIADGIVSETTLKRAPEDIIMRSRKFYKLPDVIYVSPNGNDNRANGTIHRPFKTIEAAAKFAYPGDEVRVIKCS